METLSREFIYLWYYSSVQLGQIFKYWLAGILIGSSISVFAKDKINRTLSELSDRKLGGFGVIPASILGLASPLCMYGTIPIAASLSRQGMSDDWLAAFMMSSILLNPQLVIYSAALGSTALAVRIVSCFLCGAAAGLLIRLFYKGEAFFDFSGFGEVQNRDTDPNIFMRLIRNIGRNIRATGPCFFSGILLSAMFQRYVPADGFARIFGKNSGFGVLMAATVGVPLYACGGGTIPLLQEWLLKGMSMGAAAAFMLTGPATKITNLGALKIVLGAKNFFLYLLYVMLFSLAAGLAADLLINIGQAG